MKLGYTSLSQRTNLKLKQTMWKFFYLFGFPLYALGVNCIFYGCTISILMSDVYSSTFKFYYFNIMYFNFKDKLVAKILYLVNFL